MSQQLRQPPDQQSTVGENPKPSSKLTKATNNNVVVGKPQHQRNSRTRRGPLTVGKCTSLNAVAAKPFKQVYCVDNVSLSISGAKLTALITKLGVRVLSCHEVNARMTNWQRRNFIEPDHRTFRLCINKMDRDNLLNPDTLPADITISYWHFKPAVVIIDSDAVPAVFDAAVAAAADIDIVTPCVDDAIVK
jgi:hypothetical protein